MGTLSLLWSLFKSNMMSAMEYRMNFVTEAGGMFLNDVVFVVFWIYFYAHYPVSIGFTVQDYMMLIAVACVAIGLSRLVFGNTGKVAEWISSGGVDTYLVWPKPVLLHFICSRSAFHAVGDIFLESSCSSTLVVSTFGVHIIHHFVRPGRDGRTWVRTRGPISGFLDRQGKVHRR